MFVYCFSLLKMIYGFLSKGSQQLTWKQLEHAVRRNFSGLPDLNAMEIFNKNLLVFINRDVSYFYYFIVNNTMVKVL